MTTYYIDILHQYTFYRTLILSVFCVVSVFYYLFVILKSLLVSGKKEQLTRNMLLLLPESIITQSIFIQQALYDIKFD